MKRWIALVLVLLLGSACAESASPVTGLPLVGDCVRPVILSIVHPADGKQPWGLQHADILYESLLSASGHTRYACLFHDALVSGEAVQAGPVRSIRQSHVKLAEEWQAALLYAGTTAGNRRGAPSLMDLSAPFYSVQDSRIRPYQSRLKPSGARRHKAPSNLSVDVSGAAAAIGGSFEAQGWRFAAEDLYGHFPKAAQVVVDWGNPRYMCTYIYEETHSKYLLKHGKNPAMTWLGSTGEDQTQLAFSNVIVQFTDYAWLDGNEWLPDAQLEGSGRAVIFTRGRVIEGTWTFDGFTRFADATGAEIALAPGKTYIAHLSAEDGNLTYESKNVTKK